MSEAMQHGRQESIQRSECLLIQGGVPLRGKVRCSGAKNAALPILTACLLAQGPVELERVPHLKDISTMVALLSGMGMRITMTEGMHLVLDASGISHTVAPFDLVRTMRASVLVLGPLLARFGEASVALPGGCAIGPRPIDLHIKGLEAMGARMTLEDGYIKAWADGLHGAAIRLEPVSVTATENLLMAACLAQGTTVIEQAAREPEVADLARFLCGMGAAIEGIGTDRLVIHGQGRLAGAHHRIMADRIEAGTYLVAAAMTGGEVCVQDIKPEILGVVLDALRHAGARVEVADSEVVLVAPQARLRPVDIETAVYPGFPTDMQAQCMAQNAIADGASIIKETIFENRLQHVPELCRMGAQIQVQGNTAHIQGVQRLHGQVVTATDLRASAGLVLAALAAQGETILRHVHHLDRGYECMEEKLSMLGGRVRRLSEQTALGRALQASG